MQLCCLSVTRNTYQKNTIFSKTMQFRAVLSIDNQHEVLHGFSKNTLGPSGWPWMTANLAPCPTANPMKTSPLWNLCWQHGLTCAPTNAPHLFYWHTHGIKTECDVDITLSAYVTSKLIVFVNWSNENTMPGRKEDFEKHRKRAARTLCQSSETMFQKVRKEGEAEHPRGGSRDEIADAHPSRNWVLTATNVSVIYLGVGNIAITVASQLPYVIGCFADDYRLWIFLPPLPLWCWGFPETTLGTTILELLKRFKIWGKRPPLLSEGWLRYWLACVLGFCIHNYRVGQKNRLLFILLLYLFTFTNKIPCELKLCPMYSEAQTEFVCQQVVQKNYNGVKAPEHHYVTMAKHNSNACLCLYPSNSSVQQPDSQVNNCSMCPPWTWTTAFNRGPHWSVALLMNCWSRLAQQVHTLSFRSSKPTIRGQLFNISGTFAGPRVVFLTAYQFSYTVDLLFHSDSAQPSATALRVRCVNLAQKISNRTDCLILVRQEVKVIWQKAPHGGPIPQLGVTPGGRNLYHWIPGVGVPISVP